MTPSETEDVFRDVARVPVPWVIAMLATSVASALHVQRAANSDLTISFAISTSTLVALALMWLPMLLRVVALAGGSLKAAGIEATLPGFLSLAEAIELGTKARQVVGVQDDSERVAAKIEFEDHVARLTLPFLEDFEVLPDSLLEQLARSYERLRQEMSPGAARTSAMTKIVSEVGFRAAAAPELARAKSWSRLRSPAEGDRLVGLALVQESGNGPELDEVLRIIASSSTAFEMFHAMAALQELVPKLTTLQRQQAITVLENEWLDPRAVGITQDMGLTYRFSRLFEILRSEE